MIILVILGSTSCPSAARFFLFIRCSLPWFALSLIRPFVFFVLTLLVSISLLLCVAFSLSRALFLSTLVLVLTLRMVSLSVNIVTCLRPLALSCLPPLFPLTSGLRLFLLLLFSSTYSLLLLFRVLLLLSVSLVELQSTVIFAVSAVSVSSFFHLVSAPS